MRELTIDEYAEVDILLRICGWKRDLARIYFSDDNTFGKYNPLKDQIIIHGNKMNMIRESTPCIVHELTHRNQFKKYRSPLYYILNLTGLLERSAVKNERKAEIALGVSL